MHEIGWGVHSKKTIWKYATIRVEREITKNEINKIIDKLYRDGKIEKGYYKKPGKPGRPIAVYWIAEYTEDVLEQNGNTIRLAA
jgi:predicted transcriptional regulator